ncbi:MAG: DUF3800 domain-containing protein [Actinomycetota bacterium]
MAPDTTASDSLFIFIDESGNFDFTERGTRYFVMAGIATLTPLISASAMHEVRYKLLSDGVDVRGFHASEDKQAVRNVVVTALTGLNNIQGHVIYGDKRQAPSALRSDSALHSLFGRLLIVHFLHTFAHVDYQKVVVVFDQALTKKKQGDFQGILKPELKSVGKRFHLYFHPMMADMNGQIADYLAWSKFVSLERNEMRPWTSLSSTIAPTDDEVFGFRPPTDSGKSDRPD